MSSSGLIYAFIVGAWAVYLVPMWLRREDELNAARQTQRYTTAIKVLSHKDSFERKHGAANEREEVEELPAAVGAGAAGPAAGSRTLEKVRDKDRERLRREGEPRHADETRQGREAVASRPRGGARESGVSARLPRESASAGRAAAAAPSQAHAQAQAEPRTAPGPRPAGRAPGSAAAGTATAPSSSSHALLRLRRRRVVSALFAITSLGAIISADLGLSYVWVMLIPAAVLSGYIAWVRKDEQARAVERARRHTAAIRAARESERRRQEERQHAEREAEFAEQAEQAEREDFARRSAVARRRVAAARSRADRHTTTPDQGDLPRAANG